MNLNIKILHNSKLQLLEKYWTSKVSLSHIYLPNHLLIDFIKKTNVPNLSILIG